MEEQVVLKADFKRHKGSLAAVFFLILLVTAALGTVISLWTNSESYIRGEIKRAGFGTLTAWVSDVPDMESFTSGITDLDAVSHVETQEIIYGDYSVNGQESDSEGQLIVFGQEQGGYKIFTEDLSSYRGLPENRAVYSQENIAELLPGEVYVSPSMVTMYDVKSGDEITFPVARSGVSKTFMVKGFYEDPFMGSSMIGMKGFLIHETDYSEILGVIEASGIDALARSGAMLHIFREDSSPLTVSEFSSIINENTGLPVYAEFVHSEDAIAGFMLILQNAFSGFLAAFVIVLLFVVLIVLGHSISSSIEADYVNMGILKTIGFTGGKLRRIQMIQYVIAILFGMVNGLVLAIFLSRFVSRVTVTITGILIPAALPPVRCLLVFISVLLILAGFIAIKCRKISKITPMRAIRGEVATQEGSKRGFTAIQGNHLMLSLALRQVTAGKRKFAGACIVAMLLVFFASLAGRMDSWLGADGQGMMAAFNPADHDIGVQLLGRHSPEEAEAVVLSYTDITDDYLLAMPGVVVNGIDYTANVISDPERFHIIEGETSRSAEKIVLTEFVAADLGVSVGDSVTVQADSGSEDYTVSGIYTCANDMGGNVGMSREGYLKIGRDNQNIWCSHYFLADNSRNAEITKALETAYGGDVHVHENTWPGLYGIISAMQALLMFLYGMTAVFIMVVTMMTGSKILSSEKRDMGIYKALGFTSSRLRCSFALRFGMTAVLGSVIGTLLAAILTDPLVSMVMKMAGISNFSSAPSAGNTLMPAAVVILLFTGFAYGASGKINKIDLTELITE